MKRYVLLLLLLHLNLSAQNVTTTSEPTQSDKDRWTAFGWQMGLGWFGAADYYIERDVAAGVKTALGVTNVVALPLLGLIKAGTGSRSPIPACFTTLPCALCSIITIQTTAIGLTIVNGIWWLVDDFLYGLNHYTDTQGRPLRS